MWNVVDEACAQARYTGLTMAYGTQPLDQEMLALRAEQWLDNHPEAGPELRQRIKQQFRDAFYTDTAAWKEQAVAQGQRDKPSRARAPRMRALLQGPRPGQTPHEVT